MINGKVLNKMFQHAGIDKRELHAALCKLGSPPKKGKDLWSPRRPTTGYCYVVTEVVSYVMKKRNIPYKTFRLDLGNGESHWFIRLGASGDGDIIDLTADQTDDSYDYEKAKGRSPRKTPHMQYGMSMQAEVLARMMQLL